MLNGKLPVVEREGETMSYCEQCAKLETELAEARRKQAIDQRQCDMMTTEAGRLATALSEVISQRDYEMNRRIAAESRLDLFIDALLDGCEDVPKHLRGITAADRLRVLRMERDALREAVAKRDSGEPKMKDPTINKWKRLVMVNALSVVAGWYSLYYAWGLEVKSVNVMAGYLVYIALMLPFLQSWIMRAPAPGGAKVKK